MRHLLMLSRRARARTVHARNYTASLVCPWNAGLNLWRP